MSDSLYIAVDLGAGSGRVFLCGAAEGEWLLEEVRRFRYPPREEGGRLRWNFDEIFAEIKEGLRGAGARARDMGRGVRSVGVDSWGVDYGLIDAAGRLVEDPVCYRDRRTEGEMERVFARVPREEVFARTGIQLLDFNTLFQLHAHARSGIPADAVRMLLIPDLINFFLTGRPVTEYTNATTTQMVNARTGRWDRELLERLGLPSGLLTEIVPAGSDVALLAPDLADEVGLEGVRVVAPATHDTGSAVAGAPLRDGWAYSSSGTWSLVGVERDRPLIDDGAARHNFTNEGGAFGTFRFLKNVMGLWLFESCRKEWDARGLATDYDGLLREAAAVEDGTAFIFPDDPRLFNPDSMTAAVARQLEETGQRVNVEDPPTLTRVILDSLAFRYASVLRTIESLTGRRPAGVQIVGGGSRNDYLNQATADASGLAVLAGPVEATVAGNVLVQATAAGRFPSLSEAREHLAASVRLKEFAPRPTPQVEADARRYAEVEARYAAVGVAA
ncbi:MAG TPA: rhamnulokinase family protein [Pyrinomonadaceae bacterium]|jgi:rhamnulokinase|nr:rhamnulokinase family protein [Pyrinomonadaceae bacterium]